MEHLKSETKFSMRSFAARAGFSSPSYLKMIMDGKRMLTRESISRVAEGVRLSKAESRFFEALVLFNQAISVQEKDEHYKTLLGFRKFLQIQKTGSEQYEYFSNWYNVALRELLSSKLLSGRAEEWAEVLGINGRQLQEALMLLKSLGLAMETAGRWKAQEVALETPQEMKSLVVRNFHRQMIERALAAIDGIPQEERDLTGLTIALPKAKLGEIKKRVAQFRRELNAVYSGDPEADNVYQLNFQIFPLLKKAQSKEKK